MRDRPRCLTSPHPLHGYTTSSWSSGDSGYPPGDSMAPCAVLGCTMACCGRRTGGAQTTGGGMGYGLRAVGYGLWATGYRPQAMGQCQAGWRQRWVCPAWWGGFLGTAVGVSLAVARGGKGLSSCRRRVRPNRGPRFTDCVQRLSRKLEAAGGRRQTAAVAAIWRWRIGRWRQLQHSSQSICRHARLCCPPLPPPQMWTTSQ